jgi:hypothetical protein
VHWICFEEAIFYPWVFKGTLTQRHYKKFIYNGLKNFGSADCGASGGFNERLKTAKKDFLVVKLKS